MIRLGNLDVLDELPRPAKQPRIRDHRQADNAQLKQTSKRDEMRQLDKTREKKDQQSNDKQGTTDSEKCSRQQSERQSKARDNETFIQE